MCHIKITYGNEHIPWQQCSNSEPVEDDVDNFVFIFWSRVGLSFGLFSHIAGLSAITLTSNSLTFTLKFYSENIFNDHHKN